MKNDPMSVYSVTEPSLAFDYVTSPVNMLKNGLLLQLSIVHWCVCVKLAQMSCIIFWVWYVYAYVCMLACSEFAVCCGAYVCWYVPGWCAYMRCSVGPRGACTEMLESGERVWSPWSISGTPVWMRAWLALWPSRPKFSFTNRTCPALLFLCVLLLNWFFIAVTKWITSMHCHHPWLNAQCDNSWDKCTWMFTSTCVLVPI